MINYMKSAIYRIWLRALNHKALSLLDIIKQDFYGYGYSLYSIKEDGLEQEYAFLLKKNLVELSRHHITDEKTSIYPKGFGLKVGKTTEEKQKLQKVAIKVTLPILTGIIITVISGLILFFVFGVRA